MIDTRMFSKEKLLILTEVLGAQTKYRLFLIPNRNYIPFLLLYFK